MQYYYLDTVLSILCLPLEESSCSLCLLVLKLDMCLFDLLDWKLLY